MTPDGYVLGFEPANEAVSEYLYVTNSDEEKDDWTADVILADASEPEVALDNDLDNTKGYSIGKDYIDWTEDFKVSNIDDLIWDYSVDSKDVYSLTYIPVLGDDVGKTAPLYQNKLESGWVDGKYVNIQINNGESYIEGVDDASDFIIDKSTIFVDTMNHKAYTGYNEVPDVEHADIAYVVENGVAQIIYIFDGDIYDENSIYFMLTDTDGESFKKDGDKYYEFFNAYVDGKKQSLNVSYDAMKPWLTDNDEDNDDLLVPGVLYQVVKSEEDGQYITEIRYAGPETYDVVSKGDDSFRISTLPAPTTTTNNEKFDVNEETVFVLVEYTWYNGKMNMEISRGDMDDMFVGEDHEGYKVYADVVGQDGQTAELVYLTYRQPIFNYTVNVEVGEAAVRVIGKNIDKTFTEDGTFKVQSGTYLIVDAETNEGYKFVNDDPSDADWVNWLAANDGDGNNGVYTIDATTELASAEVKLSDDSKHVNFEDTDKTVIDVEKGTEVVLVPDEGYTIQGVASDDAKIQSAGITGTNKWKVTVPASSKDVVLKVTTVADQYDVTYDTTNEWYTGRHMIVNEGVTSINRDGSINVVLTTDFVGSTNAKVKVTNAVGTFTKVDGVDQETGSGEFSTKGELQNAIDLHGTVYSDPDCTKEYTLADYTSGNVTVYWITVEGKAAVWTGTISNPTGDVTVKLGF